MAGKLLGYATSDLHLHDWSQFNEDDKRTFITIDFMEKLFSKSHENRVPIYFSGDLFHTPKFVGNKVLYLFMEFMAKVKKNYPRAILVGISGNHEIDKGFSSFKAMSLAFPDQIVCLDNRSIYLKSFDLGIYGLNYVKRNVGLVEKITKMGKEPGKKILLLHTELYGAPDPSGHEINPENLPRNLYALFKAFDLVLAGHIHKHTKVEKNVYMVGAPNQQRKSDAGCEMGYLELYEDFSVNFIKYNAPQFKYYKEGETHRETNDFWIEIPKPKNLEKKSEAEFSPTMDKIKMAKRYAKELGIKNPKRINALIHVLNLTDD